ncbi:DUF4430 domain-containing protein [Secundilactobacillus kimchicus]|uniref:DUF4430 domain-containing protein n=1 Tax=Secundilactobacillus kimchicus TaxID=528209 RepID=UPI001C020427|nr:DUF4430 domain-containing protein [Secundilactobacillus kimchicus]MBT9672395.1 DUF4430 domain-containing protein [Secundilactobacillus kimchicus]
MKRLRLTKLLTVTALLLGGLALGTGTSSTAPSAQAKTKSTKVVKATYKRLTKKAYHVTSGVFYSTSKLTRANHYAVNYPHTTFYTYSQATITRANGKRSVYYYMTTSNHKVKGWIWHGYLKKGSAPAVKKTPASQTTTTTTTTTVTTPTAPTTTTTGSQAPITPLVGNTGTSTNTNVNTEQVQVQIFGPLEEGNKVLKSGNVAIKDGDTAFDVLKQLDSDISYTGSGSSIYVTRIGSYTAGSGGVGGGWLYNVNGSYPNASAGSYKVKSGDLVQWVWTSTLGDRGWTGSSQSS